MSHVRAIAEVPTSDDPSGTDLDNPFSSAGRPVYEVKINTIEMIGVADPDGVLSQQASTEKSETSNPLVPIATVLLTIGAGTIFWIKRNQSKGEVDVYEAVLLDENDTSKTT